MASDQTGGAASSGATGQNATGQNANSGLLDAQGRAVSRTAGQLQQTGGQLDEFIRTQPIPAVLIALGIGYVLGRIGI